MASLSVDLTHPLRRFELALSLDVPPGTLALVGPSGAGKSSVLRAIAGLLAPARGRIALGADVWLDTTASVDVPAERRPVGMVFQEYALFPHLTVRGNVAYGARGKDDVDELLERFRIDGLATARPGSLSGGERQRVALARALARKPDVMLLDEPLAALDAHTRDTVRGELRALLGGLGLPTVLVTHDIEDATTLAERIGVIVDGRLLQVGTPSELLSRPADRFVASFTGANVLEGVAVAGEGGLTAVTLDTGGTVWTTDEGRGRVAIAIHPWEVRTRRARRPTTRRSTTSAPPSGRSSPSATALACGSVPSRPR